jgi:putative phosphoesterase
MTRIGILSDTHGHWDDRYLKHFEQCDEIWHCGDIGSLEVAEKLAAFRPLRAVRGNIDGGEIRQAYPEVNRFTIEGTDVLIKHIGGYPGRYDASIRQHLFVRPPRLFVCGHSHILKVQYDKTLNMLHINPGAAGIYGFHKVRTLVRFAIDKGGFKDLEVIELA